MRERMKPRELDHWSSTPGNVLLQMQASSVKMRPRSEKIMALKPCSSKEPSPFICFRSESW